MKRILVLACAISLLYGCVSSPVGSFYSPAEGKVTPWTTRTFKDDPAAFQFAIVSDRTGGCRPGVFRKAMEKLNLLQPEFVICVGDLIEGGTEDINVLKQQYGEFDEIVNSLQMRFFRVAGNHDISNPTMMKMYEERYGHAYYHFVYKQVLFLVVCTEDDSEQGIGKAQIAYIKAAIENSGDVRWTYVFMHKPMFAEESAKVREAWGQIEHDLIGRPHTVFAGHWNNYAKRKRNGQSYIHLATTGGVSGLRGAESGEFDHVVWVTMTDKGPRIANLLLDGIHDENVRVIE